jgi:CBS domain-containing protein
MDLLDLLPSEHMIVPLRAPDLRAAIDRLLDRLVESGAVAESPSLRDRIRSEPLREVVAVNDDVVLPHYRSEAVESLSLALGVSPEPIPAASSGLEVQPRIVALILAPQEAASLYLQTTSTLARLLGDRAVSDRMARQPDASVRTTLDLMLRRRLRAVPVVGEKGEVLGIVTDADVMRALLPKIPRAGADETESGDQPLDRPVRDIMTRSVLCVSEELGISEVASMMINKDVEQVPVVQAGTITGMVSRGDIIRKLFGRA